MANKTVSQLVLKENIIDTDVMLVEDEQMTCSARVDTLKAYITKELWEEIENLKAEINSLNARIEELENGSEPDPPVVEPDPPVIEDEFGFASNIIYGYYVTEGVNAAPENMTLNELRLSEGNVKILKAPLEESTGKILMCGTHTDGCPEPCTYFAIAPVSSGLIVYRDNGIGQPTPFNDDLISGTNLHYGCNAVEKVFNGVPVLVSGQMVDADVEQYMHIIKK